jgi:flavin prenyltransferase
MSKTITLAITGASGAQYGLRLLQQLLAAKCRVYLLISRAAVVVINRETELDIPADFASQKQWLDSHYRPEPGQLQLFAHDDWFAPVASGSAAVDAMVVCPASGGTLSSLAIGASNNLIERAGDVMIKERRQLILVPRETPYSQIHLENMLKLTRMGVTVLPASPGFYQYPKTIDDLVDFIVARILDQLGLKQSLLPAWGS